MPISFPYYFSSLIYLFVTGLLLAHMMSHKSLALKVPYYLKLVRNIDLVSDKMLSLRVAASSMRRAFSTNVPAAGAAADPIQVREGNY